jgi:hypothetical protein
MRKLIVLMMVLCMASLANAAIMSSIAIVDNGDDTYGINLPSGMNSVADGSGGYWVLIGVEVTSGALTATIPAALDLSGIYGDAGETGVFPVGIGVVGIFASGATAAWTAAPGIYADSFIAKAGATVLQLYTLDDGVANPELVDIMLIPEPATLAILGLGGLLLRKRK